MNSYEYVPVRHLVTLHVSVWVEILADFSSSTSSSSSRSTWACELKLIFTTSLFVINFVTLHVSVWVEICYCMTAVFPVQSHAPRERVSWNVLGSIPVVSADGHAPRERVSWNWMSWNSPLEAEGHAPRERVSWNAIRADAWGLRSKSRSTWACELKLTISSNRNCTCCVTLHVSVWVEIVDFARLNTWNKSRSTWACELKFFAWIILSCNYLSRSTWACELKLDELKFTSRGRRSRSTWACELKL